MDKAVKIIVIMLFFSLFYIQKVQAEIDSPQYRILQPAIGIDDTDNRIQTTLSKQELTTLLQKGYVVKSEGSSIIRATLSHATLTFDNQPGEADNISTVLTVTSHMNAEYQALIQAQQGLKTVWGDEIARTDCDNGCTVNFAQPWTRIDSTGFGYTLKGNDIAGDFKNLTYFRKLPDASLNEEPKTILKGKLLKDTRQATLIFRLNNGKNQPDGTYQTLVNIFIIPLL